MAKELEVREAKVEENQEFEQAVQDVAQNEIHQALRDVNSRRLRMRSIKRFRRSSKALMASRTLAASPFPESMLEATPRSGSYRPGRR